MLVDLCGAKSAIGFQYEQHTLLFSRLLIEWFVGLLPESAGCTLYNRGRGRGPISDYLYENVQAGFYSSSLRV